MKKSPLYFSVILVSLFVMGFLVNTAQATDTKYEEYQTDNDIGSAGTTDLFSFGFTTISEHDISAVNLRLARNSACVENIQIQIFATSGEYPTGSALSTGTYDCSLITENTAGEWYLIPITQITLQNATKYAIELTTETGIIKWRMDTAGGYTGGLTAYYDGTWHDYATNDAVFEIWNSTGGTPTPTATASTTDYLITETFVYPIIWFFAFGLFLASFIVVVKV